MIATSDLIETSWNVKRELDSVDLVNYIDLIETLWNVKFVISSVVFCTKKDLIETLWNVKNADPRSSNYYYTI